MSYLATLENPMPETGIELHPDLETIIVEVAEATSNMTSPLYGFHDHYWTMEELYETYKTKTGNDFPH